MWFLKWAIDISCIELYTEYGNRSRAFLEGAGAVKKNYREPKQEP